MFWPALVVAVAAVVGGAVVAVTSYAGTRGPAGAVRGYFAALQRADAPGALGFGDVPAGPRTLLTSAVLRAQQQVAPIVDLDVGTARRTGSRASVPVAYSLRYPAGDSRITAQVPVHETGGDWRLDAAAVSTRLLMQSAGQRASVLGRQLPSGDLPAFPGAPPIRLDTPYLELAPDIGIVPGRPGARSYTVGITTVGRAAMEQAVLAAVRRCLSAASPAPTCPLPTERYVPGSVHGALAGAASDVSVSLDATAVGTLELSARVPVEATSYRRLDFENRVSTGHGPVTLAVHAVAAARSPLTISWLAP